ncbi:hypothetical protein LTS18_012861, partial [Coniosporium uncinatum]
MVRTGLLPHAAAPTSSKLPTTRDIPPVTLTNIPHVESSTFNTYLAQVSSLFEAFQRAKAEDASAAQAPKVEKDVSKGNEFEEALERGARKERPASISRNNSLAS